MLAQGLQPGPGKALIQGFGGAGSSRGQIRVDPSGPKHQGCIQSDHIPLGWFPAALEHLLKDGLVAVQVTTFQRLEIRRCQSEFVRRELKRADGASFDEAQVTGPRQRRLTQPSGAGAESRGGGDLARSHLTHRERLLAGFAAAVEAAGKVDVLINNGLGAAAAGDVTTTDFGKHRAVAASVAAPGGGWGG